MNWIWLNWIEWWIFQIWNLPKNDTFWTKMLGIQKNDWEQHSFPGIFSLVWPPHISYNFWGDIFGLPNSTHQKKGLWVMVFWGEGGLFFRIFKIHKTQNSKTTLFGHFLHFWQKWAFSEAKYSTKTTFWSFVDVISDFQPRFFFFGQKSAGSPKLGGGSFFWLKFLDPFWSKNFGKDHRKIILSSEPLLQVRKIITIFPEKCWISPSFFL